MSDTENTLTARADCSCGWTKEVVEPEGGQSLVGSLCWYLARHDCAGKHQSTFGVKTKTGDMMEEPHE